MTGLKITLIDKDLGYELRCADPIPFDAEYTRDLGYAAVKFLRSEEAAKIGAIISFVEGRMQPLPFLEMLNPQTKRMKTRKVDVDGEGYECARRYMIRLEKSRLRGWATACEDRGRGGNDARPVPQPVWLFGRIMLTTDN